MRVPKQKKGQFTVQSIRQVNRIATRHRDNLSRRDGCCRSPPRDQFMAYLLPSQQSLCQSQSQTSANLHSHMMSFSRWREKCNLQRYSLLLIIISHLYGSIKVCWWVLLGPYAEVYSAPLMPEREHHNLKIAQSISKCMSLFSVSLHGGEFCKSLKISPRESLSPQSGREVKENKSEFTSICRLYYMA